MPLMLRKQIYITSSQKRLLKSKASELHLSESELIRDGMDKALKNRVVTAHEPKGWEEEKRVIASLENKCVVKGGRK